MISADALRTIRAIVDVAEDAGLDSRQRADMLWYVGLCELSGFCNTDDMRKQCARRWVAGKRRVTPPGTSARKRREKEFRRLAASTPPELNEAIEFAAKSDAADQFRSGNEKALNSLVGMVLKRYRADPAFVRSALTVRLKAQE